MCHAKCIVLSATAKIRVVGMVRILLRRTMESEVLHLEGEMSVFSGIGISGSSSLRGPVV